MGEPTSRTSSPASGCGIRTCMPRASTCGSTNTRSMVFTGAQGTPADSSASIHASVPRVRVTASIVEISRSRFRTRSALLAKSGSSSSSGVPAARQKRSNWPSLLAAMMMKPSPVGNTW